MAAGSWHDLTTRETEVLASVGRRLTNAEIATELSLSVRTVESHIASLRRKLGVDNRPSLVAAAHHRETHPVLVPPDSFIGRRCETDAVRDMLDHRRWVTITGPAGCGKTRLALELAADDDRRTIVVELEHATPDTTSRVVAKAIGMGADSTRDLVGACALALDSPCLLVLDNCDRVTDAVGVFVTDLMARARSLGVLATAQTPIGGPGEALYALSPLDAETSAARLFVDRARSAAPDVSLSTDQHEQVIRICRRVDGLPLAIELAAARVRHLGLDELERRLAAGLDPLDGAGPPSRHRTLEAAFAWTWDLLEDDEREVLSRLAASPRAFDLALAEVVAGPRAESAVVRLLDRSLVVRAPTSDRHDGYDGPPHFRLLDSLRLFVLDRTPAEVVHDVRRAHTAYQEQQAVALTSKARTDDSREAAARAAWLCPEVNAALDWAVSERDPHALSLATALSVGVEQYGPDIDSMAAITRASQDADVRQAASASDLLKMAIALCYGDLSLLDDLVDLARLKSRAEGPRGELAARELAGLTDTYLGRYDAALEHLAAAELLATEADEIWDLASVRQYRGIALGGMGDPEAALAAFESAMRTFALAGDAMHVNNNRYMMAATAAQASIQLDRATVWTEQCAAYARDLGNEHELGHALLTRARLSSGPTARDALKQALEILRSVGDLRCISRCLLRSAELAPPRDRIATLEQALATARTAHDRENQKSALRRLVEAQWTCGARRAAVLTLGALSNLVGQAEAVACCPAAMVAELDSWTAEIAEGQARWPVRTP